MLTIILPHFKTYFSSEVLKELEILDNIEDEEKEEEEIINEKTFNQTTADIYGVKIKTKEILIKKLTIFNKMTRYYFRKQTEELNKELKEKAILKKRLKARKLLFCKKPKKSKISILPTVIEVKEEEDLKYRELEGTKNEQI